MALTDSCLSRVSQIEPDPAKRSSEARFRFNPEFPRLSIDTEARAARLVFEADRRSVELSWRASRVST